MKETRNGGGAGLAHPSLFDFGSSIKAFGIPGAGGAFAYADPDAQIGFAYAPNKMGFYPWNDPREKALREAVDRSLKKMGVNPVPEHERQSTK